MTQQAQPDAAGPEATGSNVETVYSQMRQTILNGELAAGSRLSQVRLAEQYNMSRGPLREALRLLERDGLVVTEHQRMVHVSGVSFADLDELYALRIVNEGLALRLSVPRMTPGDFEVLESHLHGMDAATTDNDWAAWSSHHRDFHAGICGRAGDRTTKMLGELFDHADRYRRIYHQDEQHAPEAAAREHGAIFDACRSGDREAGAAILARHLARAALTLFAHAAPEHEPVLVREATRFVTRTAETVPRAGASAA